MKGFRRVWKKGTALFLSLALALTLCIGMNVTALANEETVSASSVDAYWSITVGEPDDGEITVTIGLLKDITVTGGTFKLQFDSDYFTMPTATDSDGYTAGVLTTYPSVFDSTATVGTNGTISFTSSDIINGDTYQATDTFLVYTLYYDDTTDITDVTFSFAVTELYDENVDDITDALGTVTSDTITITHTHVYAGDPAWIWADDYSTATAAFACTVQDDCTETYTIDAVVSSVVTEATCESAGYTTYTASVDMGDTTYTDTQIAAGDEATGHSYKVDADATVWASDYSSATLTLVCENDASHTVTLTDVDVSSATTDAACEEAGYTLYTAAGVYDGKAYTDTISVSIAATGHDWDTDSPVWTWAEDYSSAQVTFTCKNDASHTVTAAADVTDDAAEDLACTGGTVTYTATASFDGEEYTSTQSVVIAGTGHDYGSDGYCTVCGTYSAQAAADAVMTLIDAIGTVTLDSGEAITAAREAYDALLAADPEAAALVTNLDTLTAAEAAYAALTEAEGDTGDGSGDENGDGDTGDDGGSTGDGDTGDDGGSTGDGDTGDDGGSTGDGDTGDDGGSTGDGDTGDDGGSTGDGDTGDDGGSTGDGDTGDDGGSAGDGDTGDDGGSGGVGGTTEGSSYTVPSSKIAAEKVSLTGATVAQVTQTLAKLTNDGDLADSTYYLLQAKAKKTTKKSVKLSWKKVSGAKSYVIYANACGKGKKLKKYKVTSKTSLNITKIAGKKLTSGKYYKFLVIALDADGKVIQTSKVIHAATKGGSVTNAKSLTLYKSGKKVTSLTLKKGKSAKITAKVTKQDKKKKIKNHRKTKYESSNKKIATVNSKGKIKAKAKGTCYIYAYAQNGVSKKIKVTVK